VSPPEPRSALGVRKRSRPHPAAPSDRTPIDGVATQGAPEDGGLVMFCVRVAPSLRRRVKLAAVTSGRTIQQLAVEALEDVCTRYDA
jgi:hypothetical protein